VYARMFRGEGLEFSLATGSRKDHVPRIRETRRRRTADPGRGTRNHDEFCHATNNIRLSCVTQPAKTAVCARSAFFLKKGRMSSHLCARGEIELAKAARHHRCITATAFGGVPRKRPPERNRMVKPKRQPKPRRGVESGLQACYGKSPGNGAFSIALEARMLAGLRPERATKCGRRCITLSRA
jgi:hypothetical protein